MMDYSALANEFLKNMKALRDIKPQKHIHNALHGEQFILVFISLQGGSVLPGDIGSEMGVSSARVAAALNNLERKALITRQIDTSDRRKILVRITPKGKEIAEAHQQAMQAEASRMLALLGEADAVEYVRITGRLAQLAAQAEAEHPRTKCGF